MPVVCLCSRTCHSSLCRAVTGFPRNAIINDRGPVPPLARPSDGATARLVALHKQISLWHFQSRVWQCLSQYGIPQGHLRLETVENPQYQHGRGWCISLQIWRWRLQSRVWQSSSQYRLPHEHLCLETVAKPQYWHGRWCFMSGTAEKNGCRKIAV